MKSKNRNSQTRRDYLVKAGSLGAIVVAGGSPSVATAAQPSQTLDVGEYFESGESAFTLDNVLVYDALPFFTGFESTRLLREDGIRFVIANIRFSGRVDERRPELEKFRFKVGDHSFSPVLRINGVHLCETLDQIEGSARMYQSKPIDLPEGLVKLPPWMKDPVFSVGFIVPHTHTDSPALTFKTKEDELVAWPIDRQTQALLSSPNTMTMDPPKLIKTKGQYELQVLVRNPATVSKTFRGVIDVDGANSNWYFEATVPLQGTRPHEESIPTGLLDPTANNPAKRIRLNSNAGAHITEVQ